MAATDLLSVQLLIGGSEASGVIRSITVHTALNRIGEATIVINDGDKAAESFALSDSGDYDPGKTVEIKAGYHTQLASVFKGTIVSQSIQVAPQEGPSMTLICKDGLVKTTLSAKSAYYQTVKDSDVINTIVQQYSLTANVDATSYSYDCLLQYNAIDWDFIKKRAAINGLVIYMADDKVNVVKPAVSGSSVFTISYGRNLIDMDIALQSANQISGIAAKAWNPDEQKVTSQTGTEPGVNEEGSIDGKKLGDVLAQKRQLQTTTFQEESQLTSLSDGQFLFNRLARFSGYITCTGNSEVQLNTLVTLEGVSKSLNGDLFVNAVVHTLEAGTWQTEVGVGFQEEWFANSSPASSTGTSITGLQIATVKQIQEDPKSRFRVMVSFPLLEDDSNGIWARLNSLYASNGVGIFFYPEVGDEVIVGFLEDDPSSPIILGSMYSKKNQSYQKPDEKNSHKTILTKSNLKLDFDDENKIITVATPANNTLVISDKDKSITCTDQNENSWVMNKDGITITSNKSMTLKAKNDITIQAQNINLKADSGITLKSATNNTTADNALNLKATNVSIKADASLSAQAQASAEIKASGNTSIKGAMVMIN